VTCSYEAREYGIHSAMPVSQAYKLCPDAAFLPVNIRLYVRVSDNVMEIMKSFAEKFQQYSIDEAFLVPGPEIRIYEEASVIAMRIRRFSIQESIGFYKDIHTKQRRTYNQLQVQNDEFHIKIY
jgi:nucleotidyltransferase/DNA polymerase involved in DNA repair